MLEEVGGWGVERDVALLGKGINIRSGSKSRIRVSRCRRHVPTNNVFLLRVCRLPTTFFTSIWAAFRLFCCEYNIHRQYNEHNTSTHPSHTLSAIPDQLCASEVSQSVAFLSGSGTSLNALFRHRRPFDMSHRYTWPCCPPHLPNSS